MENWIPYDTRWLVELAQSQFPEAPWLAEGLRKVDRAFIGPYHTTFVDRMEGKFFCNATLFSEEHGRIILDILEDGRVAGFEILSSPFHEFEQQVLITPPGIRV